MKKLIGLIMGLIMLTTVIALSDGDIISTTTIQNYDEDNKDFRISYAGKLYNTTTKTLTVSYTYDDFYKDDSYVRYRQSTYTYDVTKKWYNECRGHYSTLQCINILYKNLRNGIKQQISYQRNKVKDLKADLEDMSGNTLNDNILTNILSYNMSQDYS